MPVIIIRIYLTINTTRTTAEAESSTITRRCITFLDPPGLAARSDPPVVPSGPLGVSPDPPAVPSGPSGVSWIPRVPSGPSGVPLDPPACPPVPMVPLGSYSRQQCSDSSVRPAAAAPPVLVSWCPLSVGSLV
jgi:hypothetical protein